jgi:hypothetical protein
VPGEEAAAAAAAAAARQRRFELFIDSTRCFYTIGALHIPKSGERERERERGKFTDMGTYKMYSG